MFICHWFDHTYSCALQAFHDLEITSDTSCNCNISETLSSFYSEKDPISYHCDINYIIIMTLQWIILLSFNCLYWQHSITEMFLIIPYISIFDGYGDRNLCLTSECILSLFLSTLHALFSQYAWDGNLCS